MSRIPDKPSPDEIIVRQREHLRPQVVFNVGGNKYRIVVEVQYKAGIVWVKFIGTHAQYDRINVESVNDY